MLLLTLNLFYFFNSFIQTYSVENLSACPKSHTEKHVEPEDKKAYLIHKALHNGLGFGTGFVLANDLKKAISQNPGATDDHFNEPKETIVLQKVRDTKHETFIPISKTEKQVKDPSFILTSGGEGERSHLQFCD